VVKSHEELEKAFIKNRRNMYRTARNLGATHAEAQDAMSKALINIVKMQDTILYADEKKVKGLFYVITRRVCQKLFKKMQLDKSLEWHTEATAMDSSVRSIERALLVHQALAELPETERFIAWNYWALEYSLRDVCEMLKERGIEWTRQNLHKFLRKILKPKLKTILLKLIKSKE